MYTTREAAAALRVQPQSIRRYTKLTANPLKAQHRGLRRDLMIHEDDLVEFARKHNMALSLPQPA